MWSPNRSLISSCYLHVLRQVLTPSKMQKKIGTMLNQERGAVMFAIDMNYLYANTGWGKRRFTVVRSLNRIHDCIIIY